MSDSVTLDRFNAEMFYKQTDESSARAWKWLYTYVVRKEISSERFIRLMSIIPWTTDIYAPYPMDGMVRGSWSIVKDACMYGEISTSEFDEIARRSWDLDG